MIKYGVWRFFDGVFGVFESNKVADAKSGVIGSTGAVSLQPHRIPVEIECFKHQFFVSCLVDPHITDIT